jgi:hypothetical protein
MSREIRAMSWLSHGWVLPDRRVGVVYSSTPSETRSSESGTIDRASRQRTVDRLGAGRRPRPCCAGQGGCPPIAAHLAIMLPMLAT